MVDVKLFIRKKVALHFARKAARNATDAAFMFEHYPEGSVGYEKGRLFAAFADAYSSLAFAVRKDE